MLNRFFSVFAARALVRAVGASLFVAVLAMPIRAHAAPPLSLPEALRLAVERAPMLDARRAQVEAAQQESRRAGALPDPMLTVGVDNLPITGPEAFDVQADFMTMKRIGLRQEIPARAKREARRALAERNVELANAQGRSERLAVRRATAEAWIGLWTAQRELDALTALREETVLASRLTKARVAGSDELVANALAAEAALIELDNRIDTARATQEAAQAELTRWLGKAVAADTSASPDFTVLSVSEAELMAALDQIGPLLAVAAQLETAAAAVDVARVEKRLDWSVAASYGQRDDRSDMLTLEFGVGLPLFTGNRQDRGVAAREADYQAAVSTREDQRLQQIARIRADFSQWEGLKRQVARDQSALLPLTRDRTAMTLAAYRAGAGIQPWLDARREELGAAISHSQRLGALGRAWAALAFLLEEPQR